MGSVIDEKTVRHIAHLSRLTMTNAEVVAMTAELSAIVGYINQLNELGANDVPETAHPQAGVNVFREDDVWPSYDPDRSLMNAPQREREFFRVPKVLETEGGA